MAGNYIVYIDESGVSGMRKGRYYVLVGLAHDIEYDRIVTERVNGLCRELKRGPLNRYNKGELKGKFLWEYTKNTLKDQSLYYDYVKEFIGDVDDEGAFGVAIVIDKESFRVSVFDKIMSGVRSLLSRPPSNYVNVLKNESVLDEVMSAIAPTLFERIVKAQALNELIYRIDLELTARGANGILFIDADASRLVDSTHLVLGKYIAPKVSAQGKVMETRSILNLYLAKSELLRGIQLADLVAYSIMRYVDSGDTAFYEAVKDYFYEDKFFVRIPKERNL